MKRTFPLIYVAAILLLCVAASPLEASRTSPAHAAARPDASQLTSEQVRQLVERYYEGVRSLNVEQYASNFARGGTLEDPAGTPPAENRPAAAEKYRPATIVFSEINMYPRDVFAPDSTNEAAVRWSATLKFRDMGLVSNEFSGITYFKFNNDGLIKSARVFWYPTDITIGPQS